MNISQILLNMLLLESYNTLVCLHGHHLHASCRSSFHENFSLKYFSKCFCQTAMATTVRPFSEMNKSKSFNK